MVNPRIAAVRLRSLVWSALALVLCLTFISPARGQSADPYADETPQQRDARMRWWREARFGMFIHWGVYSVPAGTHNGKQIAGIGEWIMNRGKIPVADYAKYAQQFNPVKFNADQWVQIAKNAGMKYIVITSKHHDGFAMFHSKASTYNIYDATPFKRDPLKELSEACQKHGIKLGFYYSQAQDWHHPGGAAAGGHWDKAQDGDMDQYIRTIAAPQVREILSNYGPISVLWWDTPVSMTKERAELLLPLLKLQPGIIYNNRLGGGYRGDTETPEQFVPATGYPGRDWETCMTMNGTWGYKSYDNNWKSTEVLIRNLVDIASKGGNYLLNVGPTSEGLIPQPSVERLAEVGKWMKVNSEAIYATTASPFKRLPWGRCTKKVDADGATLYLHVFTWPQDGRLVVPGLKNTAEAAWLLADASKAPLKTQSGDEGLVINVPTTAPDPISSTVVLRIKGQPQVEQALLTQNANGSLRLLASDAVLHGDTIQFEGGRQKDNIGYWTKPSDWAGWEVQISRPGRFTVSAEMASVSGTSLELVIGDQKLNVAAPKTGQYTTYKTAQLGTVELPKGKISIALKPVTSGWNPVNVRWIQLQPVK